MCVSVGPSVWSRPPDSPSPFLPPGWKAISLPHSDRPHYWDNLLATGLDLTRCHPASASEHCSPDSAGLGEGGRGKGGGQWPGFQTRVRTTSVRCGGRAPSHSGGPPLRGPAPSLGEPQERPWPCDSGRAWGVLWPSQGVREGDRD